MKTRKIFALALAVMMTLALAVTTFADGDYSITVKNDVAGYAYEAYQILKGDLSGSTLSNIMWGDGITSDGQTALGDAATYADSLGGMNAEGQNAAAEVLSQYLDPDKVAATANGPDKNGSYVLSNLEAGYYLVKNTKVPDGATAYSDYILKITNDVGVTPKADVPEVEKKIVVGSDKFDASTASIGDTINYEITGTMPTTLATYDHYYYAFTDTLSTGLTYVADKDNDGVNDNLKVSIVNVVKNGDTEETVTTDVTKYFYVNASAKAATDVTSYAEVAENEEIDEADTFYKLKDDDGYTNEKPNDTNEAKYDADSINKKYKKVTTTVPAHTEITVAIQDLLVLNNLDDVTIDNKTTVVITYSATLNENAAVKNDNTISLKYSNNPNFKAYDTKPTTPPDEDPETEPKPNTGDVTGETVEDTVSVYTTALVINKVDENNNALPGAAFRLEGTNMDIVVITSTVFETNTTDDTKNTYYKLKDGTYTETAPSTDPDTTGNYDDTNVKYEKKTVVGATIDSENNTKQNVEAEVDENGQLTFFGLGAGTYTITETATPSGYNDIDPIKVEIGFDMSDLDNIKFTGDTTFTLNSDGYLEGTIVNYSGSVLPETGGIGTTIFTIVGSILVVGAAILLITKKRVKAD